ncbi:unnamed protein product [Dovyalis caffra]|uniref:Uncharacterized protein n=1 Tax=Dovyalis caffra TaxID=77055 RepID=A0AAV1RPF9_9ROSI|nr:unnamed protein product [Dovyalis caffra]
MEIIGRVFGGSVLPSSTARSDYSAPSDGQTLAVFQNGVKICELIAIGLADTGLKKSISTFYGCALWVAIARMKFTIWANDARALSQLEQQLARLPRLGLHKWAVGL